MGFEPEFAELAELSTSGNCVAIDTIDETLLFGIIHEDDTRLSRWIFLLKRGALLGMMSESTLEIEVWT